MKNYTYKPTIRIFDYVDSSSTTNTNGGVGIMKMGVVLVGVYQTSSSSGSRGYLDTKITEHNKIKTSIDNKQVIATIRKHNKLKTNFDNKEIVVKVVN